jgi:hypothetical protein
LSQRAPVTGVYDHQFRILLILHGAVPDLVGAGTDDRGISGHVDTPARPVQAQPGHEDTLGSRLVKQRNGDDCGDLLQQAQRVDPVQVIVSLRPGKR